jgi:hypothetical protein
MVFTTLLTRSTAAEKYQPERTRILFVAEAPPQAADRYFYFENVQGHDWLWIALMKVLYPSEWGGTMAERKRKPYWLTKFQKSGFRLVDALKEPLNGSPRSRVVQIKASSPSLISEIRAIAPDRIVLIKKTVHDALFQQLRDSGFIVINKTALPFPATGQQKRFHERVCHLIESGNIQVAADSR